MAHNLKGTAGTIGALAVQEAAQALEHALAEGDQAAWSQLLQPTLAELGVVLEGLRSLPPEFEPPIGAVEPKESQALAAGLETLRAMLHADDAGAVKQVESLLQLATGTVLVPDLVRVASSIKAYNFEQALARLAALPPLKPPPAST